MIKNLLTRRSGRIFVTGFLVLQMLFGYVSAGLPAVSIPVAHAQLNTNTPAPTNIPQYTGHGVDESISKYLCTPDPANLGTDLYNCISKLYRFGIAFGAVALVFFVVLAGYTYITGGEAAKEKGKSILISALTGMAIILSSYVLLSFINPDLVKIKPIQPPIFSASDLPKCEDVGLGVNCVLPNGQVTTGGAGTAGSASEAQYQTLITQYAQQRGIEYCALSALMQKESSYNFLIVSNGPPREVDPKSSNKQTYNITDFDSKYHAIGLTQITIYERRRGLTSGWTNGVPARSGAEFGFSRPLYVTDLINPETNIAAGSKLFATDIAKKNGNLYEAYRLYQGLASAESTLQAFQDMYTACKARSR